jgi:hypothetical protein
MLTGVVDALVKALGSNIPAVWLPVIYGTLTLVVTFAHNYGEEEGWWPAVAKTPPPPK